MNLLSQLGNSADPTLPGALATLFRRHNFRPRKRLGQHFLVVPDIADHIIEAAEICAGDQVLEIGAGAGALTLRLARTASLTIALEVDPRLVAILAEIIPANPRLRILQADVLKVNLAQLLGKGKWKAIGNLPYSITGPALAALLEERRLFSSIVVMVQKEVAARITSGPGSKDYGALSVMVQAYFLPRREMLVRRTCFYPMPEVDSAVVRLVRRPRPVVDKQEKAFARLVRAAFSHRRKTLENNLLAADIAGTRQEAAAVLEETEIGVGRRAESLSVEEFARLLRALRLKDENAGS